MSDSLKFDVTGRELDYFRLTLKLALFDHGAYVSAFVPSPDHGLVLETNATADGFTSLPAPLTIDEAAPMIMRWLEGADYGPEPDIDGHCERGWRVHFNRMESHEFWLAPCIVSPHWMIFHK